MLTPREALEQYRALKERLGSINVAGIAGPGDAAGTLDEDISYLFSGGGSAFRSCCGFLFAVGSNTPHLGAVKFGNVNKKMVVDGFA
jgi:hypothetical protein